MKNPALTHFLGIVEHIIEGAQYTGSASNLYTKALLTYEDTHGKPTKEQAEEFYSVFVDIMSQVATKGEA